MQHIDKPDSAALERARTWLAALPHCISYPDCDGDLIGIPHEPTCPMFEKENPELYELLASYAKYEAEQLCSRAVEQALAQSRNYVADDSVMPEKVTFGNGRVVRIADNKSPGVQHGVYLEVL